MRVENVGEFVSNMFHRKSMTILRYDILIILPNMFDQMNYYCCCALKHFADIDTNSLVHMYSYPRLPKFRKEQSGDSERCIVGQNRLEISHKQYVCCIGIGLKSTE